MGDLDFNTLRQICVWDKEEKGKVVRPLSTFNVRKQREVKS
jgi:hypothetical protein